MGCFPGCYCSSWTKKLSKVVKCSFYLELFDENRDGILNEDEIIELKNILESLS